MRCEPAEHFLGALQPLCVTQLRWGMEAEKERELAQGRRRQLTEAEELQPWAGEPPECDPRLARYAAVCAVQQAGGADTPMVETVTSTVCAGWRQSTRPTASSAPRCTQSAPCPGRRARAPPWKG